MATRTALVTGYTGGIGRAIVDRLLKRDLNVIGVDRVPVPVDIAQPGLTGIVCDLSDSLAVAGLIQDLPRVDILINNAGVMLTLPHDGYPKDRQLLTMAVNLETPVALMSGLGKKMADRGSGRIVNTGSIAGQVGHPDVWYGITKAGIINATKSFASIFGSGGVVVNAVAPGPVATAMLDSIPEARKAAIKASVHSGRFAEPDEIAEAIVWLGTDSPPYINGICLDINDGAFPR